MLRSRTRGSAFSGSCMADRADGIAAVLVATCRLRDRPHRHPSGPRPDGDHARDGGDGGTRAHRADGRRGTTRTRGPGDDLPQLTTALDRFQRESAQRERLSSLGRLSTVVAHEVRNPLMIIKARCGCFRQSATPGVVARGRPTSTKSRAPQPRRHRRPRFCAADPLRPGAGRSRRRSAAMPPRRGAGRPTRFPVGWTRPSELADRHGSRAVRASSSTC